MVTGSLSLMLLILSDTYKLKHIKRNIMKNIRWILFSIIVVTSGLLFAQDTDAGSTAQQSVISAAQDGFKTFLGRIEWIYLIIFVVLAWLVNDFADAANMGKWLDWLTKIPKGLRTFLLGLVLMPIVGYFNHSAVRDEYFNLLISLIFGMVLYKLGLNYLFGIISTKVFGIVKKEA